MSEQAIDLRSTLSILRRHRAMLTGAVLLGAGLGVGLALLRPSLYTSTSLVLLPPPQTSDGQTTGHAADTEVRIVRGDVVLGPAGRAVKPAMSAQALRKLVSINAPTAEVIQIKAKAPSGKLAEKLSSAVADAYVGYIKQNNTLLSDQQLAGLKSRTDALETSLASTKDQIDKTTARSQQEDPTSAAGRADATALADLTAEQANLVLQLDQVKGQAAAGGQPQSTSSGAGVSVIQKATPAVRPAPAARAVINGLLGGLLAFVLVALGLLVFGRRDRRMRTRDEIADAIGSAVIASVRSRVPQGVAGWTTMLQHYAPDTVDAWALRQALRQVVAGDPNAAAQDGSDGDGGGAYVTLVSLADDQRGLAMGPQLASFAASLGIPTHLVAGQRHESAAALWAACANLGDVGDEVRPNLTVSTDRSESVEAALTIELVVVDRREPMIDDVPESGITVLAVSSGTATAEDLARSAVAADDTGSRIDGIVVADPDSLDQTTGRLSQHERLQRTALPVRMTGSTPTPHRASNVSKLRRRR